MSEEKCYRIDVVNWCVMPGSTAVEIANGPILDTGAELARDLLAAHARVAALDRDVHQQKADYEDMLAGCREQFAIKNKRIAELEGELALERATGGPCSVCAGSGSLLTDEFCGLCEGTGEAHQERHGLRVAAIAAQSRVAELERCTSGDKRGDRP